MMKSDKSALIMIDLQNDFCSGGSLAVPDADAVIPLANRLQGYFDVVIATQDWHPISHTCFAANHPERKTGETVMINGIPQVLWPTHCMQGTKGAELQPNLDLERVQKIIQKGTDPNIDSYSAFFDNAHLRSTELSAYLQAQGIQKIAILGLATDYCVKFSALDAVQLGFDVSVIKDACRGVGLHPNDIESAYDEMQQAGVKVIHSSSILIKE